MARIIENPETWGSPDQRRTPHRNYPWNEWSDGQWREAVRGEDFDCRVQSFVTALYHHARSAGKQAMARADHDKVLFRLMRHSG